jgi:hypothetical protein
MNVHNLTRSGTAFVAGVALFAAVSAGADAIPDTFNVSTTISASCSVTDSGPADLTPTYSPTSDSGAGSETVLSTLCNGTSPSVTFSDSYDSNNNLFVMYDGSSVLYYQISNTTSCSGVSGDNPIYESFPITLPSGVNSFDICAAVITGGVNVNAPAGTYNDTVTYSITP